jgi:hypothetical protein
MPVCREATQSQPSALLLRKAWQQACKLILSRAAVEAVTRQLSLARFMDRALDLGRKPPRAKRA